MSLKIFLIVITNAANVSTADVPEKIGLEHLKPSHEITFKQAQYEEGVSIGKHEDKILIVSPEYVFKFYDKSPSDFEKKISSSFPNSEIAVLSLNSTVDLYGYSIIKNGKRQRVKSGASLEVFVDFGEKLQEEIVISKEDLFEKEELEEMREDYSKSEIKKIIDQEASIRTTFRLSDRYFGKHFDELIMDKETLKVTQYK